MASQFDQYQAAAKRAGWIAAWQEMLRFVTPIIDRAGRYEDTRSAVMMRDLCTSQLFLSGAPGGVEPGKLSPEIATLSEGATMAQTQPGQREGESATDFEARMRREAQDAGQTVEAATAQQQERESGQQDTASAER